MNIDLVLKKIDEIILSLQSKEIGIERILVNLRFYKSISNEKMEGEPWAFYREIPVQIEEQDCLAAVERTSAHTVNKYHIKAGEGLYIGRGSVWGNPFTHRDLSKTKAEFQTESREESIEKFEEWFSKQEDLKRKLGELKGKKLVCFCKPKSCHGDVLAKLAEEGQSRLIVVEI